MHIALLLEKWNSFTPPDDTVKKEIMRIVSEMTGMNLAREAIKVQKGVVYIEADSVLKTELAMRRCMIEGELRKTLGKKAPIGVR